MYPFPLIDESGPRPSLTASVNSMITDLVITEHQFHKGVHISFQVAAPEIKITCLPIE
jgi:hypothetical protein